MPNAIEVIEADPRVQNAEPLRRSCTDAEVTCRLCMGNAAALPQRWFMWCSNVCGMRITESQCAARGTLTSHKCCERGHVCMLPRLAAGLLGHLIGEREFAMHVRHAGSSVRMLSHSLSFGLPPASLAAWENLETWESNIAAPEIPHHSRRSQVRIAESGSAAEETPAERQHRGCCDTESGLHKLRVRTQPIRFTTN